MLLIMTPGQRSPKVLMISAVCGRAPPLTLLPYDPAVPPPPPATSQDWLSVVKTRALPESSAGLSWAYPGNIAAARKIVGTVSLCIKGPHERDKCTPEPSQFG